MKDDAISRQAVLKLLSAMPPEEAITKAMLIQSVQQMDAAQPEITLESAIDYLHSVGWMQEHDRILTESAQPECDKKFAMLKVIDLNGRPYYSIIYLEDGREYEGYSSYDLMVISEYIKRYFGFEQPEIIHCKDCYYRYGRYCHYMYTNGLFISADHYCGFAKRQEDDK